MSYKLFLDDLRQPEQVSLPEGRYKIARSFYDFVEIIQELGVPEFVTFDHDLGINENGIEGPTGYDAAKWLIDYCNKNDIKFPIWNVHSANPVGARNIECYIRNAIEKGFIQ